VKIEKWVIPCTLFITAVCLLAFPKDLNSQTVEEMGKFIPPEGKILFVIGQDRDAIDAYISDVGIVPAGFMGYTSLQDLEGIYAPANPGGGTQHAQYIIERYPNTVIQIGLFMVGKLDGIINGTLDENIYKLGEWIRGVNRPVYLRIGYEFDLPENNYDPKKYVRAYRHIVDRLKKDKIDNVAYVWHSYASILSRPITDWYPGDEYVDWFAITYFDNRPAGYMDPMVELAAEHKKPLMIAESTPRGIGTHNEKHAWDRWFQPFFDFVSENNIKAVSYINSNWGEHPMWKGQGWQDARIQVDEICKKKWLDEIRKEKYLQSSLELYKILGYDK